MTTRTVFTVPLWLMPLFALVWLVAAITIVVCIVVVSVVTLVVGGAVAVGQKVYEEIGGEK